jgi:hypothetical protein
MRTERITTIKRQAAELLAYIERNKQPHSHHAARAAQRLPGGRRNLWNQRFQARRIKGSRLELNFAFIFIASLRISSGFWLCPLLFGERKGKRQGLTLALLVIKRNIEWQCGQLLPFQIFPKSKDNWR